MRAPSPWLIAVGAILVVGLALRLHSLAAGLPAINDQDELIFQLGALKMLRNGLNPEWFGHPALTTMYALAITDVLTYFVGLMNGQFNSLKSYGETIYADPSIIMLPGRLLMVAASMGCVWLVLRFAQRQWGKEAGLISAGIAAVSPVFVIWSQVIRSDIMACFFMMLVLSSAQRIMHGDLCRRTFVFAALWTAAAMASKWPFAVTALGVMSTIVLVSRQIGETWRTIFLRLITYVGMTLAWLVTISPYLLIKLDTVLRDVVGEAQQRHLGATGGSALWNAWWYASNPIPTGLGLPGLALALFGLFRLWRQPPVHGIIIPIFTGFAVLLVSQNIVWERWALPLILLLAMMAGSGLAQLFQLFPDRRQRTALLLLAGAAILVPPTLRTMTQNQMRNNDTRQQATTWAKANFKSGSRVLVEHFGFDMLAQPWTFFFPLGDAGCVNANDWLRGKVDYSRIQQNMGRRTNADYGTMNRRKEGTCQIDYAILTHYDRYLAERTSYPAEVENYQRLISRGQVVAIFTPTPDRRGGPVVRIIEFKSTQSGNY